MINIKRVITGFLMIVMLASLWIIPVSAGSEWESMTREEYIIDNWRYKAVDSDSLAFIDKTNSSNGNALKIYNKTLRGGSDKYIWVAKPVNIEKGKIYKMEFDAKVEKAISDVQFRFDWSGWSLIPSITTYDWTKFTFTYNSEKSGILELRWGSDNKIDGLWIDNVRFYDVENPDINLVTNGDFEDLSGLVQSSGGSASADIAGAADDLYSMTGTKVTLDGKADEWENVKSYPINQHFELANGTWQKPGVEPISANIKFTHDSEKFYFLVQVKDAVHSQNQATNEAWKGDSIQFGVADPTIENLIMVERWVALYPETGETFKKGDNFDAVATREGDITTYEVALPWSADFGGVQPADMRFTCVVNNNDGEGRVYVKQMSWGITDGKDAGKFRYLRLWQPVGDLQQSSYAPKVVNANNRATAIVTLLNEGNVSKTAEVTAEKANFKKSVTVEPGVAQQVNIEFATGDVGEMELDISIASGGMETTVKKRMAVDIIYTAETYHIFHDKIEAMISELKELMLRCEANGLNMPYEQANYSWICKYLELFDNEAAHGDYDRMYIYELSMNRIYEETKAKLKAYLSGGEKPVDVPKYVTSDIRIDGVSNYAMTETNGVLEERPVFFSGYLGMHESDRNIPFFQNVGVNTVQMSLEFPEMMDLFVEGIAGGFQVEYQRGCTGTATVTTEESASGKACMKLTNDMARSSGAYLQLNHRLNLEPNTTYVFGLKAKGKSQKTDFIYAWDGTTRTNIASSDDWVDYKIEFTTKKNQVSETVRILCDDITEGLYIDDVYVVKKGQDPTDSRNNLIYDGGFEISGKGPTDFEKRLKDELGLYLNPWGLENLRKRLDWAEKNNIYFDVGLGWNYLEGSYLLSSDPELTGYVGRFTPFSSDQPKIRKAMEFAIEAHADVFKDYKCVKSVMIINEPQVYTNASAYYKPHWIKYLENLYGTIEALNENYGTDYTSFEEVKMPDRVDYTPKFYDWREFNDGTLTEYITYLVGTFKKYCPNINVHAKGMDYFRYDYAKDLVNGMNYEQLFDIMDYNGCDAFCHFKNGNTPMTLKMGWYDFMTSLTERPVWDTESHPLTDSSTIEYYPQEPAFVAADLWNGAVHGRGGAVIWCFDTSEASSLWAGGAGANWSNANVRHKPDVAVRVSETNLDMMRLSYELTALQKVKRKIGIVFSRTSLGYNTEHNAQAAAVYESCIFNGQKPLFISDTTYKDINKCEVLVIPKSTTNVSVDMLNEIKAYMENGGKVILLDDISLKYDEYNKPHDESVLDYICKNADRTGSVGDYIKNNKMSEVILVDSETGETPENVEWLYNECNGKMLVNILYYSYDEESDRTFEILYNGKEIVTAKELRSGKTFQTPYTVTPYEPILLEFEM